MIYVSWGHEILRILSNPKFFFRGHKSPPPVLSWATCVVPKDPPKTFALSIVLLDVMFVRRGVVSPLCKLQAGGTPLFVCPKLLIEYIRSYPLSGAQINWSGDRLPLPRPTLVKTFYDGRRYFPLHNYVNRCRPYEAVWVVQLVVLRITAGSSQLPSLPKRLLFFSLS